MNIFESLFNLKDDIENIDDEVFAKMMNEEPRPVILDVRTSDEHQTFRIPDSIHIDCSSSRFVEKLEVLDKSQTYLVYCASGGRSIGACRQMKKLGFKKVYNLKSGILNWRGTIEQGKK